MKNYSLTETFFISQDSEGNPLEFPGSDHALACLAYDIKAQQLVELNLLTESEGWNTDQSQGLFERLVLLAGVNGGSVPRVLRRGKMDGLMFFTLALEEGEILTDYSRRTGGIPERMTLELLDRLLTKLTRLQALPRLFRACSLADARLIYSPQGAQYERVIQIRQLGLHQLETRTGEDAAEQRLATELGQLVYQMLTGHISPVRGGPLVESVRLLDRCFLLRQFVANAFFTGGNIPLSFADAATALSSARQFATDSGANALSVPPFSVPWLSQIFGSGHLDYLYPVQFELSNKASSVIDEISARPATDTKTKENVFLLPLPGKRILPRPQFPPAPDGLAQIPAEKAIHLLFPHSTWNSEHFTFHVEKSCNSFTLREFLQYRGTLQPGEMLAILTQVEAAHQEATALGLTIPSLKSSAVRCVFRDDCDQATLAERCRMTVSHWPSHLIKVRVHASLNSVTNPWPAGIDPDRADVTQFNDAFALLAVEMAGGSAGLAQQGHLPTELVKFLQQQAQAAAGREPVLEPAAFLKAVSQRGGVMNFVAKPIPIKDALKEEAYPVPHKNGTHYSNGAVERRAVEGHTQDGAHQLNGNHGANGFHAVEIPKAPETQSIPVAFSASTGTPQLPEIPAAAAPIFVESALEVQPEVSASEALVAAAPHFLATSEVAVNLTSEPVLTKVQAHPVSEIQQALNGKHSPELPQFFEAPAVTEIFTEQAANEVLEGEVPHLNGHAEPETAMVSDNQVADSLFQEVQQVQHSEMTAQVEEVADSSMELAQISVAEAPLGAPDLTVRAAPSHSLPASSPAAIAAQFKSLVRPMEVNQETEKAPEPPIAEEVPQTPSAPNESFQLFKERTDSPSPEPVISTPGVVSAPASELEIAPFPTDALVEDTAQAPSPEPAPATVPYQPKSFPPSKTGLVTWRFEDSRKPEAKASEAKQVEIGPMSPVGHIGPISPVSETPPRPVPAAPADALSETEHSPSAEEPLKDLPTDDFGAPTLNIDLARLTTSDSLFSRRPRTITIRNR